jgi:hypothetical protein
MNASKKSLALTSTVFLLIAAGYELHRVHERAHELQDLQTNILRQESQLQRLQDESNSFGHDVDAARRKLATLQAASTAANGGREAELKSWQTQVSQIQRLFVDKPDQAIPELEVLSPLDWLRLCRDLHLGSELEIRKSLAAIRNEAGSKFVRSMSDPLRKYLQEHNDLLPTSPSELAPYFDPSVNPAALLRYEMLHSGKADELPPGTWVIASVAPVDEDYDGRIFLGISGSSGAAPWSKSEWSLANQDAMLEFTKANGGHPPTGMADLVPYVQSPVLRTVMQGLVDYMQAHGGRQTNDVNELLPYLTSPEAKTMAAKIWQNKSQ